MRDIHDIKGGTVAWRQDTHGHWHTDFLYRDAFTGSHRCSRFPGRITEQQARIGVLTLRGIAEQYKEGRA